MARPIICANLDVSLPLVQVAGNKSSRRGARIRRPGLLISGL
jgi:hypothetical protein